MWLEISSWESNSGSGGTQTCGKGHWALTNSLLAENSSDSAEIFETSLFINFNGKVMVVRAGLEPARA